jgi:pSer/pThr/pTyr-binding forkhead associated (FHA) protein
MGGNSVGASVATGSPVRAGAPEGAVVGGTGTPAGAGAVAGAGAREQATRRTSAAARQYDPGRIIDNHIGVCDWPLPERPPIFAALGVGRPSGVDPPYAIGDDRVNRCGFCGRENEELSSFCIDCGKPMAQGGARVIPVPAVLKPAGAPGKRRSGSKSVRPPKGIPDTRVSAAGAPKGGAAGACAKCGQAVDAALPFCPHCGSRVDGTRKEEAGGKGLGTSTFTAREAGDGPRLALLDRSGAVTKSFAIDRGEVIIGRLDGDLRFPDDAFLSPVHAQVAIRDGSLLVRDLGSRNGTWIYLDAPYRLRDGDTLLIGSQLIRFRRLGYPGPHPPESNQTRRLGSFTPGADIAVLEQLRADGSARDTMHLSPARGIAIGRDQGDWLFPYDQTMSGKHAEVRNEDLEFIVVDAGSRNGVAVAVRGEKAVAAGQRFLVGDQTLRVEVA